MNRNKMVNRNQIKEGLENLFLFLMSISPEKRCTSSANFEDNTPGKCCKPQKTLNKNN